MITWGPCTNDVSRGVTQIRTIGKGGSPEVGADKGEKGMNGLPGNALCIKGVSGRVDKRPQSAFSVLLPHPSAQIFDSSLRLWCLL